MSSVFSTIFSMGTLWGIMVALYALICIALIMVIMLQKGKGVGFAGAFGVGPGSETIFGPRGSKSLPVRLTQVGAGVFMLLAFLLSALANYVGQGAAPEEVSLTAEEQGMNELEQLGLGGADPGATAPVTLPAPTPEAPAPEATTEPVAVTPAPEVVTEPVDVTPAPETATEPVAVTPAPEAPAPEAAPETPAPAEQPAGDAS